MSPSIHINAPEFKVNIQQERHTHAIALNSYQNTYHTNQQRYIQNERMLYFV